MAGAGSTSPRAVSRSRPAEWNSCAAGRRANRAAIRDAPPTTPPPAPRARPRPVHQPSGQDRDPRDGICPDTPHLKAPGSSGAGTSPTPDGGRRSAPPSTGSSPQSWSSGSAPEFTFISPTADRLQRDRPPATSLQPPHLTCVPPTREQRARLAYVVVRRTYVDLRPASAHQRLGGCGCRGRNRCRRGLMGVAGDELPIA